MDSPSAQPAVLHDEGELAISPTAPSQLEGSRCGDQKPEQQKAEQQKPEQPATAAQQQQLMFPQDWNKPGLAASFL